MAPFPFQVARVNFNGNEQISIDAGFVGRERIVPPAGEEFAFWCDHYRRRVTINVSPTGRSVRVWVDGIEVK